MPAARDRRKARFAQQLTARATRCNRGEQKWAASVLREHGATVQQQTLVRWLAELGVQAPTLYWHVASKQVLLDQMATTMLRDLIASG